jgi:hypothetical protein
VQHKIVGGMQRFRTENELVAALNDDAKDTPWPTHEPVRSNDESTRRQLRVIG